MRRGGQHVRERGLQRGEPVAVPGDGAGEVGDGRAVAQEPERLRVHEVLRRLVERELRVALDLAVERIDALPQRRQLEHLARGQEGVGDVGRACAASRSASRTAMAGPPRLTMALVSPSAMISRRRLCLSMSPAKRSRSSGGK